MYIGPNTVVGKGVRIHDAIILDNVEIKVWSVLSRTFMFHINVSVRTTLASSILS